MGGRSMKWRVKMVPKPTAGNIGGPYYLYFPSNFLTETDDINEAHQWASMSITPSSVFNYIIEECKSII